MNNESSPKICYQILPYHIEKAKRFKQTGTQNSVIAKLALLNFRFGLGQCSLESNLFGGKSIRINGIIYFETWGGWPKIINDQ